MYPTWSGHKTKVLVRPDDAGFDNVAHLGTEGLLGRYGIF